MRSWILIVLGLGLLLCSGLAACDSDGAPGDGDGNNEIGDACASRADCADGLECAGPDDPQVCGIPPREGCVSDDDCTAPNVCHAISDTCSPDGQGSECRMPCSTGSCESGFRCGVSGACEAIPCEAGDCAEFDTCDPEFDEQTPVFDHTSGCRHITCDPAADSCPGTTECVNGRCQSDFGQCAEPMLVP